MSLCILNQYQECREYLTSSRLCVVLLYFMTNLLQLFIFIQEVKADRSSKTPSIFCVFGKHPFHLSTDRILAVSWRHCSLKFSQVEIELFLLSLCTSQLGNVLSVLFCSSLSFTNHLPSSQTFSVIWKHMLSKCMTHSPLHNILPIKSWQYVTH